MNNIFKIIWSHSAQLFVVTSELAKGKVKSASSSKKISSVTSSTTSKISLLSLYFTGLVYDERKCRGGFE